MNPSPGSEELDESAAILANLLLEGLLRQSQDIVVRQRRQGEGERDDRHRRQPDPDLWPPHFVARRLLLNSARQTDFFVYGIRNGEDGLGRKEGRGPADRAEYQ